MNIRRSFVYILIFLVLLIVVVTLFSFFDTTKIFYQSKSFPLAISRAQNQEASIKTDEEGNVYLLSQVQVESYTKPKYPPQLIILKRDRQKADTYRMETHDIPVFGVTKTFSKVKMVVDQQKQVHMVWQSSFLENTQEEHDEIIYLKMGKDGSVLVPPTSVHMISIQGNEEAIGIDYPSLSVDREGNAYVAWSVAWKWSSLFFDQNIPKQNHIQLAVLDVNGRQDLDQSTDTGIFGSFAQVQVDKTGQGYLVWETRKGTIMGGDLFFGIFDVEFGAFQTSAPLAVKRVATLKKDISNISQIFYTTMGSDDQLYVFLADNNLSGDPHLTTGSIVSVSPTGNVQKKSMLDSLKRITKTDARAYVSLSDQVAVDSTNNLHMATVLFDWQGPGDFSKTLTYERTLQKLGDKVSLENNRMIEY